MEGLSKKSGSYVGKVGEHLVCSELLFRGFNASIMSVDTGIDLAAVKENRFFGIQVKTSNKAGPNRYHFHITLSSIKKHNESNIFYIFVLCDSLKRNFLILPSAEVDKQIKQGVIRVAKKPPGYSVAIKFKNDEYYLGKGYIHKMNYYLNNWESIK